MCVIHLLPAAFLITPLHTESRRCLSAQNTDNINKCMYLGKGGSLLHLGVPLLPWIHAVCVLVSVQGELRKCCES